MKTIINSEGNLHDTSYHEFLTALQRNFEENLGDQQLFTTDASPDTLWDIYSNSYPADVRQFHNCHACRKFIQNYGGLVVIRPDGSQYSPIWYALGIKAEDQSTKDAIDKLAVYVSAKKVTGVFVSSKKVLGQPITDIWRHLAVNLPKRLVHPMPSLLDAGQRRAELRENLYNTNRALADYTIDQLKTAVRILQTDALYRSEKVLGPAEWLLSLKQQVEADKKHRHNLVWRAVAAAPNGFCHIRSGVLATLLDDIVANLPFDDIARKFADKMHPLQYQRPTAPPAEGAIERAEKLVEKLGIAASLERRFAQLSDLKTEWTPQPIDEPQPAGIFRHLRGASKQQYEQVGPATKITWVKFRDTVLPLAKKITMLAPSHAGYTSFVTAVHPDAPPILQWDRPESRNPVSWYMYVNGSPASRFHLTAGDEYEVSGIVLLPPLWSDQNITHFGNAGVLVINGAHDVDLSGLALFPETLKSELHEVRSVIEAFSRKGKLQPGPHAAGVRFPCEHTIRVVTNLGRVDYIIDRWD